MIFMMCVDYPAFKTHYAWLGCPEGVAFKLSFAKWLVLPVVGVFTDHPLLCPAGSLSSSLEILNISRKAAKPRRRPDSYQERKGVFDVLLHSVNS
jgi:hypothetical protein